MREDERSGDARRAAAEALTKAHGPAGSWRPNSVVSSGAYTCPGFKTLARPLTANRCRTSRLSPRQLALGPLRRAVVRGSACWSWYAPRARYVRPSRGGETAIITGGASRNRAAIHRQTYHRTAVQVSCLLVTAGRGKHDRPAVMASTDADGSSALHFGPPGSTRQQAWSRSQVCGEYCSIQGGPPAKSRLALHHEPGDDGDAPASQLGGPPPLGFAPPVIWPHW